MRDHDDYRANYRNAFLNLPHAIRKDRRWAAWLHANVKAKLEERRTRCEDAREAHSKAFALNVRKDGVMLAQMKAHDALIAYWRAVPRSRVVSRILRELDPQMKLA